MSKLENSVTSMKTRSKGTVVVNMDPDSLVVRRSVGSGKISTTEALSEPDAKDGKVGKKPGLNVPSQSKENKTAQTSESPKSASSTMSAPSTPVATHKHQSKLDVTKPVAVSPHKRPALSMASDTHAAGWHSPPRKRKVIERESNGEKIENDFYCWLCHKEGTLVCCELCVRSYHLKCLARQTSPGKDWVCPECEKVMRAECTDTRSKAMSIISLDQLMMLLKFALQRMNHHTSGPFQIPVDINVVQNYTDFIINPMDLKTLEMNIQKKMYGCTEAFLADAKWILHNCIVFNGSHHKLTSAAKSIVKICRHEMNEIEICPDCYTNASTKSTENWFCEPCRTPHTLVWAKLKGYPFWPAKILREVDGQVDVRFFGAHDRAWVPVSQVYLLSRDAPTQVKNKKGGFDNSVEELEQHIDRIKEKFGHFEYAGFRTPYDKNNAYSHNKFKPHTTDGVPVKKLKLSAASKEPKKPVVPGAVTKHAKISLYKKNASAKVRSLSSSAAESAKTPEKQSVVSKTASALKNKYSSIITTRRAAAKTQSNSSSDNNEEPVDDEASSASVPRGVFSFSKSSFSSEEKPLEFSVSKIDATVVRKPNLPNGEILKKLQNTIEKMNQEEQESAKGDEDENENKTENNTKQFSETSEQSDKPICDKDNKRISDVTQETRIKTETSLYKALTQDSPKSGVALSESSQDSEKSEHAERNQKTEISENSEDSKKENTVEKNLKSDATDLLASEEHLQKANSASEGKDMTETCADRASDEEGNKDNLKDLDTPSKKRNSFLENLVASCKAKLGISESEPDIEENASSCVEGDSSSSSSEESESEEDSSSSSEEEDEDKTEAKDSPEVESEKVSSIDIKEKDESASKGEVVDNVNKEEPNKVSDEKKSTEKNETENIENEDNSVTMKDRLSEKDSSCTTPDGSDKSAHSTKDTEVKGKKSEKDETSASMDIQSTDAEVKAVTEQTPSPNRKSDVWSNSSNQKDNSMDNSSDDSVDEKRLVIDESPKSEKAVKKQADTSTEIDVDVMDTDTAVSNTEKDKSLSEKEREWNELRIQRQREKFQEVLAKAAAQQKSPVERKPFQSPKPLITPPPRMTPRSTAVQSLPPPPYTSTASSPVMSTPPPPVLKFRGSTPATGHFKLTKAPAQTPSPVLTQDNSNQPQEQTKSSPFDFNKYSNKVLQTLKGSFEEMYNDLVNGDAFSAIKKQHVEEIERLKWQYLQQLAESRHNAELTQAEMRASLETEKNNALTELRKHLEVEKQKAVDETKKKQWCANCFKEAIFYCCWNTSYCDYPCQQAHWPTHMPHCTQSQNSQQAHDKSQASVTLSAENLTTQVQRAVNIQQSPSDSSSNSPVISSSQLEEKRRDSISLLNRQEDKQQKVAYTSLPQTVQFIQPANQPRQILPAQSSLQVQYVPVSSVTNIPSYQQQPQMQRVQMQAPVLNQQTPLIHLSNPGMYQPVLQQPPTLPPTQIIQQRPLLLTQPRPSSRHGISYQQRF